MDLRPRGRPGLRGGGDDGKSLDRRPPGAVSLVVFHRHHPVAGASGRQWRPRRSPVVGPSRAAAARCGNSRVLPYARGRYARGSVYRLSVGAGDLGLDRACLPVGRRHRPERVFLPRTRAGMGTLPARLRHDRLSRDPSRGEHHRDARDGLASAQPFRRADLCRPVRRAHLGQAEPVSSASPTSTPNSCPRRWSIFPATFAADR